MRVTVDTNVLLRLAVRDSPAEANRAAEVLRQAERIAVPTIAFCEMAWVLRRGYRRSNDQIVFAIEALRNTPNVVCDEAAVSAGVTQLKSGGDFADAVIALEGRRLGGTLFVTFDKKAALLAEERGIASQHLSGAKRI